MRSHEAALCRAFLAEWRQQKRRPQSNQNDVLYNAASPSAGGGGAMAAATFLCLSLSKAAAGVEVAVALHLSNFRLQTPSFLLV